MERLGLKGALKSLATHYFGNWPEGLFILLVMIVPVAAAFLLFHASAIRFIAVLAVAMASGFIMWLATLFLAACCYDRGRRK